MMSTPAAMVGQKEGAMEQSLCVLCNAPILSGRTQIVSEWGVSSVHLDCKKAHENRRTLVPAAVFQGKRLCSLIDNMTEDLSAGRLVSGSRIRAALGDLLDKALEAGRAEEREWHLHYVGRTIDVNRHLPAAALLRGILSVLQRRKARLS